MQVIWEVVSGGGQDNTAAAWALSWRDEKGRGGLLEYDIVVVWRIISRSSGIGDFRELVPSRA